MKSVFLAFVIVVFGLQASTVSANQGYDTCINGDSVIFFANGVKNSEISSFLSRLYLEDAIIDEMALKNVDPDCGNITFGNQFNPSNGLIDFYEALLQIAALGELAEITNFILGLGNLPVPESWKEKFVKWAEKYTTEFVQNDRVISDYTTIYSDLLSGSTNNIVIVAHSQGNLYANLIYQRVASQNQLDLRKRLGIVSVASPDKERVGWGSITLNTDEVISGIRKIKTAAGLEPPLSPNTDNAPEFQPSGWLGHSFIDNYMKKGSNSQMRITSGAILTMWNGTSQSLDGSNRSEFEICASNVFEDPVWCKHIYLSPVSCLNFPGDPLNPSRYFPGLHHNICN